MDNFYRCLGTILGVLGVFAAIFVLTHPLPISGTELFFLLPLIYAICVFSCKNIFLYHIDGFGLKCFLIITFVRYVLLPTYACSLGQIGEYNNLYAGYYVYGILVQLIELIVSYAVIYKNYNREYKRISRQLQKNGAQYYNSPGIVGLLLGIGMVLLVVVRGHLGHIIEMARFFVVTDKYDMEADFWTYDIWAIQVFFTYSVVVITSFFMKRNDKSESWFNVIVPLVLVFLSCTIILTNNRMTMVYFALSGLCVLNAAFPKKTKILSVTMITVMLTVIVSFTLMKNFGIDINEGGSGPTTEDSASALSAYVCGVDNVAHSCDMYSKNGTQYGIANFFSMLYNFAMPTRLPFLHGLFFKGTPTAVDLACNTSEMVSVSGETLFWGGGMILGWLFDIVAVYCISRLLVVFEIHTKLEQDLGKKYIYNWLAVLFGIFMCYCVQTLWNNTTYIPLYLGAALWVNKKFKFSKSKIINY